MRHARFILLAAAMAAIGNAQPAPVAGANDPVTFEVASVKPSTGCPPACGLIRQTVGSQGYHAEGATLRALITVAYTVTDRQISGGPEWINSERWDIEAKAARPRTPDELHTMLRHLLEERFHLTVRQETRQETVLALVVAKGGAKITPHDAEDKNYPPMGPRMVRKAEGACLGLPGTNVTMNYFAFILARVLSRAVIDQTKLEGRYDVNLEYAPETRLALNGEAVPTSPDCQEIYAAIPKQLGLKLESTKGPVEFLAIDGAQKPTAN